MRVVANFNVGGSRVHLDKDLGMVLMSQRDRFDLLKHRTDKMGNVWQQKFLNGDRMNLPELLEASAPTVAALLDSVEADELRLRGPVIRNSHTRTVRTMSHETGLPEYTTDGMKHLDTGRTI